MAIILNHNDRCKQLVNAVDNISQNEMEEIFKMIHNHGCSYTRNNNGLFINLRWIPEDLLNELEQYVKFCSRSQTELKKYESICDVLNTKLKEATNNIKDDTILQINLNFKENTCISTNTNNELNNKNNDLNTELDMNIGISEDDIEEIKDTTVIETNNDEIVEKQGSKISSSMKYSLLKKRYAKMTNINFNTIENDLKQEHYIIKN